MDNRWQDWVFALWRIALVIAIGLGLGWALGHLWWGLVIALAFELGRQLSSLHRLDDWLRHRNRLRPPQTDGLWGDVVSQISRLHRRKQHHKQRILNLFRELRRSTASMPDGVVALNAARDIVWFNRKAAELLGLRRGTDLGISIASLVRTPGFSQYLAARDFATSMRCRPNPGEVTCLEFQGVPYGEGQMFLLVRDVTRQLQFETMRKDFVANASHELRSPLTVISGYLEAMALDPSVPDELRQPVLEMRRQTERMTALIEDLLELSRLEATDEQVVGIPVDMAELFALLKRDLAACTEGAGKIPLEVSLMLESTAGLVAERGLLHSALWNLLENAAKFTPKGGRIALRWWVDAQGGHCSVTDTGPGIAAEHLPRLTERFYRVDPGRTREQGGSGLGLAIVRHVLQRHGASLHIESTPGQGSIFTCHFPPIRIASDSVSGYPSQHIPAMRA